MLTWTPALSVGVAEIDAQHQELFRRANAFIDAIETPERTAELLAYLRDHARVHFSAEERWMAEEGYPDLEPHRREHAGFLDQLGELDAARQLPEPIEVARWLVRWLHEHVVVADTAAARHALRHAGGTTSPEGGANGAA